MPTIHREGNFALGGWVHKRRVDYRNGRLTVEQVHALERLPGWTWSPWDDDFRRGLNLVRTFARREGHAAVPHHHVEDGFKLGYWVAVKRIQHRKGRLPRQRVRALEELPSWSWRRMADRFRKGLEHLRRFVKRDGHARVPARHREGTFRLGIWLSGIRRSHGQRKLPRRWARTLEVLPGWTWNAQDALFERGLGYLTRFVRREHHARVPSSHLEDRFRLGQWVGARREQFQRRQLSAERVRTLEAIPGWTWSVAQARFEEGFQNLLQYVKREGHARVPAGFREGGFPLGQRVRNQRRGRRRLPAEQARRLAKLAGWVWSEREAEFEARFRLLQRYVRRESHPRVPQNHVEGGVRLGRWVANLRRTRDHLSLAKKRRLGALSGWTWRAKRDTFDKAVRLLEAFEKREGHARVPQRHVEAGFPLGAWVSRCRLGKVRMTRERRRALASVRGWLWAVRGSR